MPIDEPIVVRLRESNVDGTTSYDAVLVHSGSGFRDYDCGGLTLRVLANDEIKLDRDVLLVPPGSKVAHRLVRADSVHNTFLVTEQCDQLCVMCSQPPKKHHVDLFDHLTAAAALAPTDAYIGISGGEPLLHKHRLLEMMERVSEIRPDIHFHVLTNAQHFEAEDLERVANLGRDRILWGVPLYSADAGTHDMIVGKQGAFSRLKDSLAALAFAGASIELRTVVMKQNIDGLRKLAEMVARKLPFVDSWAIMQMERIGYGRMNWATSFVDTSEEFDAIAATVNLAEASGVHVNLYNFPRCTVPKAYRDIAPPTISDWKRKYLEVCDGCSERDRCTGFFEWYKADDGFKGITRQ
jgi:His-Xaa-Ser system radical SAM maturase HxsC